MQVRGVFLKRVGAPGNENVERDRDAGAFSVDRGSIQADALGCVLPRRGTNSAVFLPNLGNSRSPNKYGAADCTLRRTGHTGAAPGAFRQAPTTSR